MNTEFFNKYPDMNGRNLAYFVFIREVVDFVLNGNYDLNPEVEVFLNSIKDSANRGAKFSEECWTIYRKEPKNKEDINDQQTQIKLGIKPKEQS